MQTFLPYPDFYETAKVLDYRRLGKQRVETKQILLALLGESTGWVNHPATRMWAGHEGRLAIYGLYMCSEWRGRGYEDNLFGWFDSVRREFISDKDRMTYPYWFGCGDFHFSHQKVLAWKNKDHYCAIFGIPESSVIGKPEYIWPV